MKAFTVIILPPQDWSEEKQVKEIAYALESIAEEVRDKDIVESGCFSVAIADVNIYG